MEEGGHKKTLKTFYKKKVKKIPTINHEKNENNLTVTELHRSELNIWKVELNLIQFSLNIMHANITNWSEKITFHFIFYFSIAL